MAQLSDITKLAYFSPKDAFKNNRVYTGNFNISGTTSSGTNVITHPVTLDQAPDMVDIVFNGADDPLDIDLRPADGWFKRGAVTALGTDAPTYVDEPTFWQIYGTINSNTLTITAIYVQTFVASLALTATPV